MKPVFRAGHFICSILLLGLSTELYGNMYEVSLPITNQTIDQNTMMKQAFKNVLTQVTGSEMILSEPNTQQAIEISDTFVKQFSYKEDALKQRQLLVKFDETKVNDFIKTGQGQVWKGKRPTTAVWLVVARDKNNPTWIGGDFEPELVQEFTTAAKQRALPLIFPLLDLTDTALISEKTIWNSEMEALKSASNRYRSDVIWMGKISKQASGWHGQWTLLSKEAPIVWDNTHEELNQLCKNAMDELTTRLSTVQNSPTTIVVESVANEKLAETKERYSVGIAGIKGMEQYSKILTFLKTIPEMGEVEVQQISANQTIFNVLTTLSKKALAEHLAKGPLLPSIANQDTSGTEKINDSENLNFTMAET